MMLLRIWRAKIRMGALMQFEDFVQKTALPTLRSQPGCVEALVGRDESKNPPEYVVVSLWKDLDALKGFAGPDWQKPVVDSKEAPLLDGIPLVEHFNLAGRIQPAVAEEAGVPQLTCSRCGQQKQQMRENPYPGTPLGQRIVDHVCVDCWQEWGRMEMRIMNEYRLTPALKEHRQLLISKMKDFLNIADKPAA